MPHAARATRSPEPLSSSRTAAVSASTMLRTRSSSSMSRSSTSRRPSELSVTARKLASWSSELESPPLCTRRAYRGPSEALGARLCRRPQPHARVEERAGPPRTGVPARAELDGGVGHEIGDDPGEFGALVLLEEVSGTDDGGVCLSGGTGDFGPEHAVTAFGDRVGVGEGAQARPLESA